MSSLKLIFKIFFLYLKLQFGYGLAGPAVKLFIPKIHGLEIKRKNQVVRKTHGTSKYARFFLFYC